MLKSYKWDWVGWDGMEISVGTDSKSNSNNCLFPMIATTCHQICVKVLG